MKPSCQERRPRSFIHYFIALAGFVSAAQAQDVRSTREGDAINLQYDAPAACPDIREFLWRVNTRLPAARRQASHELARAFIVHVELIGKEPVGRLTIHEPDGSQSSRVLSEADCRELVDALALMVALALDPHASLDSAAPEPVQTPQVPPSLHTSTQPRPERAALPLRLEASLQGVLAPLRLPELRFGSGGIAAGIFVHPDRLFSPSVRFYRHGSLEYTFEFLEGTTTFQWWTLGTEMCPATWSVGGVLLFRPCAVVEVHQLRAEGRATRDPERANVRWLGLGAGSRLTLPVGQWLFLDLSLAFVLASRSDRFELGAQEIHRISPLDGRAALGIGVQFP